MATRRQIRELELLLAQLVDEGSSADGGEPEAAKQVEQLLLNDESLQDHYWKWMDVHVLLGVDGPVLLDRRTSGRAEALDAVELASLTSPTESRQAPARRRSAGLGAWAGLAASVAVISAAVLWGQSASREAASSRSAHDGGSASGETLQEWRIPKITRVKWTGPYFAESIEDDLVWAEVRPGRVELRLTSGATVNGYLLKLDPGETVDLVVTADAVSENNFSITELDSHGTPLRRSVTFNNYSDITANILSRGTGLLGSWSAANESDDPKYYLLTGVHQVANPDAMSDLDDVRWRISNMAIVLDEPDAVLLGWDDGGVNSAQVDDQVEADEDFDDVIVLLRVASRRDKASRRKGAQLRIAGASKEANAAPELDDRSNATHFTLQPGEAVGLAATSSARLPNYVYLQNDATGEILWSVGSESLWTTNLGGALIENTGAEAIQLSLFGEHYRPTKKCPQCRQHKRYASKTKVLYEQRGCTAVGFEDLGSDADFDDVRVTIIRLTEERDAVIDADDADADKVARATPQRRRGG